MTPAHSVSTISLGLFEQRGGWVFVGVAYDNGFYGPVLFSGKRKSLYDAIESAKKLAPEGAAMVYSRLDNTMNDWN